jgi:hypothetical protein
LQKINEESILEKTSDKVQNSTKKRERKTKAKETTQTAESKTKFPVEGKINKYGFIYLENDVFSALGLSKGVEQKITIELQEGALMIRKV